MIRSKSTLCFLIVLSVNIIFASMARGAIYHVKQGGTGLGGSWADAAGDLRAILDGTVGGDEVWVAAGVYKPTAGADRTLSFQLKISVEVYGGFPNTGSPAFADRDWQANQTILSGDIDNNDLETPIVTNYTNIQGNNSYHVVNGSGVDARTVLDGFVITGGYASGASPWSNGAGVYINAGGPRLNNVWITGNRAGEYGGGIYNDAANPRLSNCIFENNHAADGGGGMHNRNNSNPVVDYCIFRGNKADCSGGGVENSGAGSPTFRNVLISGNLVADGAGILGGGGMTNENGSTPQLLNVTITGNDETGAGSGDGMLNIDSDPTLQNVIVWGNASVTDEITNTNSTPNISYSLIEGCGGSGGGWNAAVGADGGGNIDADPLFATPVAGPAPDTSGDLHLLAGSPAVDAGSNTGVTTTDLDGNPRIVNGTVDMGAYEFFNVTRNALHFDGASDRVRIPNSAAWDFDTNDDFTVEFWVKPEDPPNIWYVCMISGRGDWTSYPFAFTYYPPASADYGKVSFARFDNSVVPSALSDITINDGLFHHIAGVRRAGELLLYIDGKLVGSTPDTTTASTQNGGVLFVGDRSEGGGYEYKGIMDELRIWNVGLTEAQIHDVMSVEINQTYVDGSVAGVSWSNLTAYYQFDEGIPCGVNTGVVTLPDVSNNSNDGTLEGPFDLSTADCTSNWTDSVAPAPIPIISSSESGTTNANPIPITIDFNTSVIGFSIGDITVANGTPSNLVDVGNGVFTLDVTPGSSGVVTIDIAQGVAQNASGNPSIFARQFSISYIGPPPGNCLDLVAYGVGSNDYVEVPDNTLLQFASGQAMTIELWAKPTYVNHENEINILISKRNSGSAENGYSIYLNSYNTYDRRILFESNANWVETVADTITWDVWQHIAVTVSTAGVPIIYLNGVPQTLETTDVNLQAGNDPLRIGAYANNWTNCDSQIDEVRIWRTERTQAEIQANMNTILTGAEPGLAAYYRFDQGRDAGVNTDLPNEVIDYSPNCLTGTMVNAARTGPSSNWVYASADAPILTTTLPTLVTETTATGNGNIFSIGSGNATQRGFVWSFSPTCPTLGNNQGSTAEAGSFGTGTFSGSITGLIPGTQYRVRAYAENADGVTYGETQTIATPAIPPPGNALDFDGANDYVSVGGVPSFEKTDPYTIECWVNISGASTGYAVIAGKYDAAPKGWDIEIEDGTGRLIAWNIDSAGNRFIVIGTTDLRDDTWHHVAVSYDGSNDANGFTFWIDGNPEPTTISQNESMTGSMVNTADLVIGGLPSWGEYVQGSIDELRIWNVVRTRAEIQANRYTQYAYGSEPNLVGHWRFDQGNAGADNTSLVNEVIDYSGNCYNGVLNNASLTGASSNWVFPGTQAAPILTTTPATLITGTAATGNGNIFSIGSGNATTRGFVWSSLTTCPTLGNNEGSTAEAGSFGTGAFTGSITGLAQGTQYWVRAYAVNGDGTTYGETQTFTTLASSPEMDVQGNLLSIIDGDATPAAADHTDFGNVNIGGSFDRTFTILNTGTADLTLTVPITVAGADFSVLTQPVSPVIAGGSATFVVRFAPTIAGIRTGTVSIANNDADENPYDFSIQGTGVTTGFTIGAISGNTTEAGGQATFTVVLNALPTADVVIPVSSSDTTEGTVSTANLTFTTLNWNAPQTVTVTGVDDAVADGDMAYSIILSAVTSADPSYNGLDPADVAATNTDNDSAGFTVGAVSGNTTEAGGQATFTAVLNSQPTADVVIPVGSSDLTEGTVSPASLTFTTLNWNAPQTVTVTGVDDAVADGDMAYSIILSAAASADPGYNGLDPADAPATNTDNDSPGFTVGLISGNTTEAGGQATFTVVLNSQPTADVAIPAGSSDATEGTVSPASLTFTPVNWNAPQTVTVTGADDFVADGDQIYNIVLSAAASADPNYNGLDPADVAATNTDDDSAGFTVGPISGNTTEAGGQATFTAVLNSQPTADVAIPVSSSDTTEGTVSPASLTFTAINWNAPQTVTITGVDDAVADGDQVYSIVLSAAVSADPVYSGLDPADVPATNTDNDSAGFTVGPISGNTTEAGGQATFTLVLNSQPTADVTVALNSSDTTEGTLSTASLTFTPVNWNAPRTVTVTGMDDAVADGDQVYSIVLSPAVSTDPNYDGGDPSDVPATNTDDDSAGFTVGPVSGDTTEAGGQAAFTVVLNSQPTADVTVAINSSDASEGTASPANLVFTSLNWNAPRTVTVTGANDSVADGNQVYSIVLSAAVSGDPNYDGADPPDVSVTNTDDDSAGFTTGPVSGNTSEAGIQAVFTLVLNSEPTANVTVAVNSSDVSEGTVSPATLTFTPLNWNAPQTVTATGVDDPAADGNQIWSIILQPGVSADPGYNGVDPADAFLSNTDNDFPGFTASPISGDVTEAGGQADFTVWLTSRPAADVAIPVSSSDISEGTVLPANLTFTPLNWDAPQTVTVTGADDFIADGNQSFFIRLSPAASADPDYNGTDPADVPVTNTDDETAGFTVGPVSGDTRENGNQAFFTVRLNSQPLGDVAIDVTSSDISEGTVFPAQLIFTGLNWNAPQTVTVTGENDDMADGNQTYSILLAVNAANTTDTTGYAALDPPDATLANIDDETAGFTVTAATTETAEDGTFAEFFVRLNSMPSGNVAVSVISADPSEGTALPATLIFTPANWNADQKVTVTGVDDDVADGSQSYAVLLSTDPAGTADATGYASLDPPDVWMTNNDDETAGFTLSQISGPVGEDGTAASFTIRLNSEPAGDVRIDISSSDTSEGTVFPSGILFTSDNWKSPATITVTGVNDDIADGNMPFFIRLSIDPAGTTDTTGYAGLDPPDVEATNTDDDSAGFIVSATGRETAEQGGEVALAVRLTSEPAGNVSIIAESSDTSEAILFPATLFFTPSNWNADQLITIRGVDDDAVDGNRQYMVRLTLDADLTAGSPAYLGLNPPDEVFTNIDDETAGFTLGPVNGNASEDGDSASFTVRLNSEPASDVVIQIVSRDPTEGDASPDTLIFTPGDWNREQTVTVSGVDDPLADGDQSYLIRLSVESEDADYADIDPGGVRIVTADDETAGFTIGEIGGDVSEDGGTAFFTIRLNSEPAGNVWIDLASSDTSEGTVFPASILFTPENWRLDQTVTVTGVDDGEADGDARFFIRLTVNPDRTTAPGYIVLYPGEVAVVNRDNDSDPEMETDSDGDGIPDALDLCPFDPEKTAPGLTGCGVPDTDSDDDGVPDYYDGCPNDPEKFDPGVTGCGFPDFTNFCPCELDDEDILPENHPVGISPPNESAITDASATIVIAPAPEGTEWIHWRVRRINETEWEMYDATLPDETEYIVGGLEQGVKYAWQAGFESLWADEISWSPEYTFKSGNYETEEARVDSGTTVADYQLISFTAWPSDPTFTETLGPVMGPDLDRQNFRIASYAHERGCFVEYGCDIFKVEPGRAYWFLARDGLDMNIQGVPVSLTEDFELQLFYNENADIGWNMIASPNDADYFWGDLLLIVYGEDGQVLYGPTSLSEMPWPNDYIYPTLWEFESGYFVGGAVEVVRGTGYWICVKQEGVSLIFPAQVQIGPGSVQPPDPDFLDADPGPPPPRPANIDESECCPDVDSGGGNTCFVHSAQNGLGWIWMILAVSAVMRVLGKFISRG